MLETKREEIQNPLTLAGRVREGGERLGLALLLREVVIYPIVPTKLPHATPFPQRKGNQNENA